MQTQKIKGTIIRSKRHPRRRVLVSVPLTGLIRAEWAISRYGQVIPCNWSQTDSLTWLDQFSPLGFAVADARNIAVHQCLKNDFEWLFFIDHDVIMPPDTIIRNNDRMLKEAIPMWSGLYFTKSVPSEPLVYRGMGEGYYTNWKLGDKIWVGALPMGCTMIHSSILKVMAEDVENYTIFSQMGKMTIKRVFETPAKVVIDPELQSWYAHTGTEDLNFCRRVVENKVLKRAGWPEIGKKKYPFLLDTKIFCRHINFDGIQYPSRGEENYFKRNK